MGLGHKLMTAGIQLVIKLGFKPYDGLFEKKLGVMPKNPDNFMGVLYRFPP